MIFCTPGTDFVFLKVVSVSAVKMAGNGFPKPLSYAACPVINNRVVLSLCYTFNISLSEQGHGYEREYFRGAVADSRRRADSE